MHPGNHSESSRGHCDAVGGKDKEGFDEDKGDLLGEVVAELAGLKVLYGLVEIL